MKMINTIFMILLFAGSILAETKILSLKGEVYIRHGVSEEWVKAAVGDVLKPDDSMKSGKKSAATVSVDGKKKITIPEMVIVDVSDLRELNQDEFLLMLAMEQVRSVSLPKDGETPTIPRTTTVHGEEKGGETLVQTVTGAGGMELNGTSVLFSNGFYGTFILKAKRVLRLYPSLDKSIETRMQVADAFERLSLKSDALGEYRTLRNETLSARQKSHVDQKIAELKKAVSAE